MKNLRIKNSALSIVVAVTAGLFLLLEIGYDQTGYGQPGQKQGGYGQDGYGYGYGQRYFISGHIIDGTGQGVDISGITVSISGCGSVMTDEEGWYRIAVDDGTYTVTPSKENWSFDPSSQDVIIEGADGSDIDFIGITPLISSLEQDSLFSPGDIIEISGTAAGPDFVSYKIEYGRGINPAEWFTGGIMLADGGFYPVVDGFLGQWNTEVITNSGTYTLRLTVEEGDVTNEGIVRINIVGPTVVPASEPPSDNPWRSIGPYGSGMPLRVNPFNPDVVYAGSSTGAIYRSSDGANSWCKVYKGVATGYIVSDLLIDPWDPDTVYAVLKSNTEGRGVYAIKGKLLISNDAGETWEEFDWPDDKLCALTASPTGNIYMATEEFKIYEIAGTSWTQICDVSGRAGKVEDMACFDSFLVIATSRGIYRCGVTPGSAPRLALAAIAPFRSVAARGTLGDGAVYAGNRDGQIFATYDNFGSWSKIADFCTPGPGLGWVTEIRTEDSLLIVGVCDIWDRGGVYITSDEGANWDRFSPRGADSDLVYSVDIGPDINTIYAGQDVLGVYKTEDMGQNWHKTGIPSLKVYDIASGMAGGGGGVFYALTPWSSEVFVFDNEGSLIKGSLNGTMSTMTNVAADPNNPNILFRMVKSPLCFVGADSIQKSTDCGVSWSLSRGGLNINTANSDIAIHPHNSDLVYALDGRRVFKSLDGGGAWDAKQYNEESLTSIAMDPFEQEVFYLGTPDGLFKSYDGGITIQQLNYEMVSSIAVDPSDPDVVWMGTECAGLFKSVDGGLTFEQVSELINCWIADIVYNPVNPDIIAVSVSNSHKYATTGGGTYLSQDRGTSWESYNFGLGDNDVTTIEMSWDGTVLLAGTSDNSCFIRTIPGMRLVDFIASPTNGTAPLTVEFTDLSSGFPESWQWDFGDEGTSTLQHPTHEYTQPGTYTVSLAVTTPTGGGTETKVNYITVRHPAPIADFSATPRSGDVPLTVEVRDLSSQYAGTITSWQWDFGDEGTNTLQNPTHEYTQPGTYTVTLRVIGTGGTDTETKIDYITVRPPAPIADFTASPRAGDAPLNVEFTDLSSGFPTSWSWDFGDEGTSTLQHPSHEYTQPGIYTVTLTATNATSRGIETKTDYITVSYPAPIADFSATPRSGNAPLNVEFTDLSSQYAGTITSWQWDFGDEGTSNLQHPSHEYTQPGIYTVALTVIGDGGPDVETKTDYITVSYPAPIADFSATPRSGNAPLTVEFRDLSSQYGGTITSWQWDFGDEGTSNLQHPSHEYTQPGTYTVKLTVTGLGGFDAETKIDYIKANDPTAIIYVNKESTSPIEDGTEENPYKTIHLALANAQGNPHVKTIEVMGSGVYNEPDITLINGGTLRSSIRRSPVIQGTVTMAENTTLEGFRIEGGSAGSAVVIASNVSDVTILHNTIIAEADIPSQEMSTISITEVANLTIMNNIILNRATGAGCKAIGLAVRGTGYARNIRIINNTIDVVSDGSAHAIYLDANNPTPTPDDILIKNNILTLMASGTPSYCVNKLGGNLLPISYNNLYVDPAGKGLAATSVIIISELYPGAEGNLQIAPLYVNRNEMDFRLRIDSPCKGAGEGGVDMGALLP